MKALLVVIALFTFGVNASTLESQLNQVIELRESIKVKYEKDINMLISNSEFKTVHEDTYKQMMDHYDLIFRIGKLQGELEKDVEKERRIKQG